MHRKMYRPMLKALRRRPSEDPVERGVAMFRLISGPNFEADPHPAMMREAVAIVDVESTARQSATILASLDRTEALGRSVPRRWSFTVFSTTGQARWWFVQRPRDGR